MSELTFQERSDINKKKAQELNEKIMRFNYGVEKHQENLNKIKAQALQTFGTDDFDKLCQIAEERAASNDKKQAEFDAAFAAKEKEVQQAVALEKQIMNGE